VTAFSSESMGDALLVPEALNPPVKEHVERLLPRLVRDGAMDLARAQRDIADDWIGAYKKYFNTAWPVARQAGLPDDDDDVIQFETAPHAPSTGTVLASFVRPAVLLATELTSNDAPLTARVRRVAW